MRYALVLSALALWSTPVTAQEHWTSSRPDGHAPLGVMADHTHGAGELMASYRFMYMSMDGLRTDTDGVEPEAVLEDYPVTPTRMPMRMHMLGLMYAPSDRVTLMGMLPILDVEMEHRTRAGGSFTTSSSGVGDATITAMIVVLDRNRQKVHLMAGLGLPTGSIDETGVTPASDPDAVALPYPMQTGSGTLDARPGITYLGQTDVLSWGAQATADLPLGENDRGYTVGSRYDGTGWVAVRWGPWASTSLRIDGSVQGDYSGADASLNASMVPTADPELRDGTRVDLLAGLNLSVPRGPLAGHRVAVEAGFPAYQDLDGPQLERDWVLVAGWQFAWGGRDDH
jgi:hypothetical protein